MTIKQSLEHRIRGWFPKEPYLGGNRTQLSSESKQPPLVIQSGYNTSAAQSARALTIVWIVLDSFLGILTVAAGRDFGNIFPWSVVVWIITGIILGACSGIMFTRSIIQRISKDYQYHPSLADVVQFSFPIIIFSVAGLTVIFLFYSNLILSALIQLMASAYTLNTASMVARSVLFPAYEKRETMQLMQKVFGGGIIAIPKPPNSNVNTSEMITKKEAPTSGLQLKV